MADFAATNTPGSCLWCGHRVPPLSTERGHALNLKRIQHLYAANPTNAERQRVEAVRHHQKFRTLFPRGGFFCRDKCAMAFGIQAAQNGYRFQPKAVTRA